MFGLTVGSEVIVDDVLRTLGLPKLEELRQHIEPIQQYILRFLDGTDLGGTVASMLKWVFGFCDKLKWTQRIFGHAWSLPPNPPVPVLFKDGYYIDGSILRMAEVRLLSQLARRREEMLRYIVTRDIVDEESRFLEKWMNLYKIDGK